MNSEMHKYLCWLDQIRGIGRKTRFHLVEAACSKSIFLTNNEDEEDCTDPSCRRAVSTGAAKRLYDAPESELRFWCTEACQAESRTGKRGAEEVLRLLLSARKQEPARVEENLLRAGISFSCIMEEGFPERLRDIPDPPFGIYFRGKEAVRCGDNPAAAVIGARLASGYGREQARRFARDLAYRGVDIVSGMAKGIDGIAQKAALDAGGRSYAVLGCGVDICYPEENQALYERLLEAGGILSEFPPGTPPDSKNFPQRNRIISGLADLVLVIEARKRSGTLITVDMALEQGREVYALPGRVSDSLSDGCNRLIRQGAGIATCPKDVLEFFFGLEEDPSEGKRGRGPDARRAEKLRVYRECEENRHGKEEIITEAEGGPAGSAGPSEKRDPEQGDEQGGSESGSGEEACARDASARSGGGLSGASGLSETGGRGPAYSDFTEQQEDPGGRGSGSCRKRREKGQKEGGGQSGEENCEESCGGSSPQPEQSPRFPKKRSALETAVLRNLSVEDETHLERVLEAVNLSFSKAGREQVTLTELIMTLMRLQIEGLVLETASGYYRKRGRWE